MFPCLYRSFLAFRFINGCEEGVYTAQVDAGARSGRHVVCAIWLASHKDESYYMCGDVILGG